MKTAFYFVRAFVFTTAMDTLAIAAVLYFMAEFDWIKLLAIWAALLAVRFLLWLRLTAIRFLDHFLFKSEAIDNLTRILRTSDVPTGYKYAFDFDSLATEVMSHGDAPPKAKQMIAEMTGYLQGVSAISPTLALLHSLKMDRAAKRFLA